MIVHLPLYTAHELQAAASRRRDMLLMPVRTFVVLALLLIGASTCSVAAQETNIGQEEYLRSCAECHGQDGSGIGPMTSKLQVKPADLRTLATRTGGVYSPDFVFQKIDGRKAPNLHPTSAMPIWGCRQLAPSGIRSKSTRGERWSMLSRSRHSKASKKGRKKNRSEARQDQSFLDMPCDSEAVIHDRIQSVVDYLRTIQVK
jgi:mono/diheme cytochrome c family protein